MDLKLLLLNSITKYEYEQERIIGKMQRIGNYKV